MRPLRLSLVHVSGTGKKEVGQEVAGLVKRVA